MLVVLAVGVSRVTSGATDAGDVVTVAYLLTIVSFPIRAIGWLLGEFPRSVVGFRRTKAVLAATGSMPYGEARIPDDERGARLVVDGLHYAYDADAPLLKGVYLRGRARTHGRGGGRDGVRQEHADRSDDPPRRSRCRPDPVDGEDLRDLARGALAGSVALVPQTAFLFDDTVRGNVTLGADIPDEDVWAALRDAQADGFVAALGDGLGTKLGERGTSLSGGQRQRISLARALVRRPRLLILDDATSAVDPEVEARILASLRAGSTDATLVVVAYRKATIGAGRRGRSTSTTAASPTAAPTPSCSTAARPTRASSTPTSRPPTRSRYDYRQRRSATSGTRMDTGEDIGAMDTIRRGVAISPELREGLGVTLLLAVVASCGQVVVPIAVQQTLDKGLNGPDGPRLAYVVWLGLAAAVAIVVTSIASYLMTKRLFTTSERGLATLRVKAFRHVHDLPLLTQNTERRGALVSRVTSDVDQVSQFLVFGGLIFVVSVGQMLVATVIMVIYSWELALVVWLCFAPLFASIRYFQRKLSQAYGVVRHQVGVLLGAISEPVVGAAVVRSYAVEDRTQRRIDTAIDDFKAASTRAQKFTVVSFSLGGISAGLANAGVLIVGVLLGFTTDMTAGKVLAFAFLVTLFVGPVQMGTQILTDAQNAIVSWRRVIGILETPADLVDPGPDGQVLPRGPLDVTFDDVDLRLSRRPRRALRRVDAHRCRHSRRDRGGDGVGQVDLREAADAVDGSRCRGGPARRHRRPADRPAVAAQERRAGAAGGLPVRRHHHGQRALRQARRLPGGDPRLGRRARAARLARCASRTVSRPRWASAGSRCRPASASSWHCCGRTWPTRTCWSSTRRPAPSTRSSRCGSVARSNG